MDREEWINLVRTSFIPKLQGNESTKIVAINYEIACKFIENTDLDLINDFSRLEFITYIRGKFINDIFKINFDDESDALVACDFDEAAKMVEDPSYSWSPAMPPIFHSDVILTSD